MRKAILPAVAALVAATNAYSADLPRRVAATIFTPVPAFTWTGFYAGLNAGYARSNDSIRNGNADGEADTTKYLSDIGITRLHRRNDGFAGGGQVGYNYQFTPGTGLVVGVEADAQYTDLKKKQRLAGNYVSAESVGIYTGPFDYETRNSLGFLGTVRGRVGVAFDRLFVYGTGGLAYGQVKFTETLTDAYSLSSAQGALLGVGSDKYAGHSSRIQTGYAYGGGIEYALATDSFLNLFRASAVTLKLEYLHYDLGKRSVVGYDVASKLATLNSRVRTECDIIRVGVNYKFGTY